jgi:hypothetical protein
LDWGIPLGKLRLFCNRSGQKSTAQRTVRNKADSKFFERWQDFFFRTLSLEGVLALNRRNYAPCLDCGMCEEPAGLCTNVPAG